MNDYDAIAAYYDAEHSAFHQDVDFFLNLIRGGPVLELGSGTGRVMEPLARAGLQVWGVEPSAEMLSRARERLGSLDNAHLVQATASDVTLGRTFAAAILSLNTLWHASDPEEQLEMLRAAHRHLRPGGLLIVDLSNPLSMSDRDAAGEVRQAFRGHFESGLLTRTTAAWDDPGEQTIVLSITFEVTSSDGSTTRSTADMRLRYLYRSEAELLLRLAGFNLRQTYGSYDLDPYTADGPGIILVAEAR